MTNSITQKHNQKAKKQAQKTKKQRSCRTKRSYASLEEATGASNHLHGKGIYVKPYQCSICKKFHITKRSKGSVLEDLFKKIEKERLGRKP